MNQDKPNFFDQELSDLSFLLSSWGEPQYRTNQIWQGIYQGLKDGPLQIPNIPKSLREKLADHYHFKSLIPESSIRSKDGQTVKTLFRMVDGQAVETVLMNYKKRRTLCISTQSGCAMGCVFCATGQMGFYRNLTRGEITEQVVYFGRNLKDEHLNLTNIVVMGMGEPFHNYEETLAAVDRLNHPLGMNLGARRFTISTVGLIPEIIRFTKEKRQVNLAVSLHAADDELRSSMLPVNRKYPLKDLIEACREYVNFTHRRITFEWALVYDKNDTLEQANKLAHLLRDLICHVNIIPLNPTHGYTGKATTKQRAEIFKLTLQGHGIPCSIRVRRGIEIRAGCGQLASGT